MGIYRSLSGQVALEYTSADVASVLLELEKHNIPVYNVRPIDEISLEFTVQRRQLSAVRVMADRRGERVRILHSKGLFWPILGALKRPILIVGLMLLLALGSIIPGRILFVSVEGNRSIPSRQILEAVADCGLSFGASRRAVRSEQVKNHLLDAIPQLKWAGVNTYGSRAVITVKERDHTSETEKENSVGHIAARRDGIITSTTVTAGYGLCTVGQAVKEGDILISGYTDCGIMIRAEMAKGQIFAETNRNLTVKMPSTYKLRVSLADERTQYSLILGKKRINFYKGSGISGSSCVKMKTEYVLHLPGGFELPVSLVKEGISYCSLESSKFDDPSALLESFAADYLDQQMTAGTVIQKRETVTESEEFWILKGQYACIEDIGVYQDEMIGDFNGKTDGTDRER